MAPALGVSTSVPPEIDRIRAGLLGCDDELSLFTKIVCEVNVRHHRCGELWGKIPECPVRQRNNNSTD